MYVFYKEGENFAMTTEDNYNARIMNDRIITRFKRENGFASIEDCKEYAKKYMGLNDREIKGVKNGY